MRSHRNIVRSSHAPVCSRSGWLAGLARAVALLAVCSSAANVRADRVAALRVEGNERTEVAAIESVLPCALPCEIGADERLELERRLYNLAIFDRAEARLVEPDVLRVRVRERWTLIPFATFSTGESAADLFIAAGVTEYNLLGTASSAEVSASWEQRGPNAAVFWADHDYDARAGGFWAGLDYTSSSFRFADGHAWYRDAGGAALGWKLPFPYGSSLRWSVSLAVSREAITRVEGGNPPVSDGTTFGTTLGLVFDRYSWRDLAPSGLSVDASVTTAAFVPAAEPRHAVELTALGALAATDTTVLMVRAQAGAVTAGNPNHSLLLGSVSEVRGVEDAFHRNRAQLVGNLELRQALRIAERWALQGALFTDAAWFEPFDARGVPQSPLQACSAGAGVRLIPTLLAEVVLRIDVARLLWPKDSWFWQLAFNQFF